MGALEYPQAQEIRDRFQRTANHCRDFSPRETTGCDNEEIAAKDVTAGTPGRSQLIPARTA
jgi:hypothetical protein